MPLKENAKKHAKRDMHPSTSWWFQPIWKTSVKIGNFPQIGMKIKNIWNHHPVQWFFFHIHVVKSDLPSLGGNPHLFSYTTWPGSALRWLDFHRPSNHNRHTPCSYHQGANCRGPPAFLLEGMDGILLNPEETYSRNTKMIRIWQKVKKII